jgi:hypothetical protein
VVAAELITHQEANHQRPADQAVVGQDGMVVQKHSTQAELVQPDKDIPVDLVYTITELQQVHTTVVVVAEVLALMDIIDILDTIKPAEAKASLLISAEL